MLNRPAMGAGTDEQAAAALEREVRASGEGYVELRASTLAALFLFDDLSPSAQRAIAAAIARCDLESPELSGRTSAIEDSSRVVVRQRSTQVPSVPRPVSIASVTPDPVDPRLAVMEQGALLPAGLAVAGAVVTSVAVGLVFRWVSLALALLVICAGVAGVVYWRRPWLARAFFVPTRSLRLSAWLLGVLPVLLIGALAAVVLAPVQANHRAGQHRQHAGLLVEQAQEALGRGDRERAHRLLDAASDESDDATGLAAASDALDSAERAAADQQRRSDIYTQARSRETAGQLVTALGLYRSIAGTRDSDTRSGRLATQIVNAQLRSARQALARGSYAAAIGAAQRSDAARPTTEARRLIASARAGQARARARARAAARARAELRAQQRAARRAAAKQRAAQLKAQRDASAAAAAAAEAQQADSSSSSDGGGGGYGGMNCDEIGHSFTVEPGSDPEHDRDNDGLACESQ